jgi:polyisoprenoid-binding protein YceI
MPVASVFAALLALVASPPPARAPSPPAPGTHAIVAARSSASFAVMHVYIERVVGTVPILSGSVAYAPGETSVPSSVQAVLDARHVDTRNADRDDDLQGPDWFDTKHFPTWAFTSTSIVPAGKGFTMTGTLTIHGVSQPIALAVTTLAGLPHAHYRATGTVDRHAFGMHVTPFDGVISSKAELTLDVVVE